MGEPISQRGIEVRLSKVRSMVDKVDLINVGVDQISEITNSLDLTMVDNYFTSMLVDGMYPLEKGAVRIKKEDSNIDITLLFAFTGSDGNRKFDWTAVSDSGFIIESSDRIDKEMIISEVYSVIHKTSLDPIGGVIYKHGEAESLCDTRGKFRNVYLNLRSYLIITLVFLAEYRDNVSVTKVKKYSKKKITKGKVKSNRTKSKLYRNKYFFDSAGFTDIKKTKFTRVTESWRVRGHWRRLKNGGLTWVRPHKKGSGKERNREYIL